jgi:hypothetical protein
MFSFGTLSACWARAVAFTERDIQHQQNRNGSHGPSPFRVPTARASSLGLRALARLFRLCQELLHTFCAFLRRPALDRAELRQKRRKDFLPGGASCQRRKPRDQRSRGSPYRASEADGTRRLLSSGAREIFQCDERRDAAALDRAQQPQVNRAHHPTHRPRMVSRSGT